MTTAATSHFSTSQREVESLWTEKGDEARPYRKPSPITETYSRAVEYEIDEENMLVRQKWQSEQKGPDSVVSIAMGDVDWLPKTENILGTDPPRHLRRPKLVRRVPRPRTGLSPPERTT